MDDTTQLTQIDPIDSLPKIDFNEEQIISLALNEKYIIDTSRSWWFDRKLTFLHQWDDFINFQHPNIIESQPYIHIPMTFGKIMTWHARMYNAIFSTDPVFNIEPLNLVSMDEIEATKMVLRWYLRDEINYQQGLKPVIDEMLWDLGCDGWAVIFKQWETRRRLIHDIQAKIQNGEIDKEQFQGEIRDVASQIKKRGRPKRDSQEYQQIAKVMEVFNGVTLKTIPQENVYFPDYIPTSSDLNYPRIVMLEEIMHEEDVLVNKAKGLWYSDACDAIFEAGKGYDDGRKMELRQLRQRLQSIDQQSQVVSKEYPIYHMFLREDLDDDGIPEEYVFTMSLRAKKVLACRYLEQISSDSKRPIYKFDLLKRPRSAYSRGWVETLYSLNCEVDDFHNIRRVSGLIANVPWGFYRASSGMDKEAIEIAPGKFYPVDDPQSDVRPMQFPNVTTWALQEEQLAQSYGDQLTSMPAMLQGQMPQMIGPMRSTSGMLSTIQESSAPLSVQLDRMRGPFGDMINGVLCDLQVRLPKIITLKILGDQGELLFGQDGQMLSLPVSRGMIGGRYKFSLAVNDAQYNPEKDKQEATGMVQTLISQFPVQMGLVNPQNAYYLYRNMLKKMGVHEIDKYITPPQLTAQPQNLWQEYNTIINGEIPKIVLNDDHEGKIKGLMMLAQSPEYQEGKIMNPPTVSPIADLVMEQAIKTHTMMLQTVQSLNAQGGQGGMQPMGPAVAGQAQNQVNQPRQAQVPGSVGGPNIPGGGNNGGQKTGPAVANSNAGMAGTQGASPSGQRR